MAFSLTANPLIASSINLTNGSPFRLENAEVLEGAPIIRHRQRSPLQNGMSDLGFRLQPREMQLNILFTATTDAILDGYRDTLMAAFRPFHTLILSATLDSGAVRTLTCQVVGEIEIGLVREERPGHLHRATVTLRAANPLWKANDNTIGTVDYATELGSWWLAGGAIGTSQIKTHVENPTLGGQNWATFGSINGPWAIAVVTEYVGSALTSPVDVYIWDSSSTAVFSAALYRASTATLGGTSFVLLESAAGGIGWPGGTGVFNYHAVHRGTAQVDWKYWTGSTVAINSSVVTTPGLGGTGVWGAKWGSGINDWDDYITKAMIWADPTDAQVAALAPYMLGSAVAASVSIVNDGDVDAPPVIQLHGPMIDPVIVNDTVGGTIDLTGITVPANETWTIDLRTGDKKFYDAGGANMLGSVTSTPIGMADFALAPSPIAAGGTNVITVTPGSASSASYMTVQITNTYLSL